MSHNSSNDMAILSMNYVTLTRAPGSSYHIMCITTKLGESKLVFKEPKRRINPLIQKLKKEMSLLLHQTATMKQRLLVLTWLELLFTKFPTFSWKAY